jgi:hypothetical protein
MTRSTHLRWATFGAVVLPVLFLSVLLSGSAEVAAVAQEPPQSLGNAKTGAGPSASRAPTSAYPARYYIPHIQEAINVNNTFCSTAIVVTVSFNASKTDLDLEVFDDTGTSVKLDHFAIGTVPGTRWTIITDDDIAEPFSNWDSTLNLANLTGFAIVSSSDPRIFVTAYEYCRAGTGALDDLVSMNAITVYPVGTTLDFLKAELPTGTTLPHVGAPVPDSVSSSADPDEWTEGRR